MCDGPTAGTASTCHDTATLCHDSHALSSTTPLPSHARGLVACGGTLRAAHVAAADALAETCAAAPVTGVRLLCRSARVLPLAASVQAWRASVRGAQHFVCIFISQAAGALINNRLKCRVVRTGPHRASSAFTWRGAARRVAPPLVVRCVCAPQLGFPAKQDWFSRSLCRFSLLCQGAGSG